MGVEVKSIDIKKTYQASTHEGVAQKKKVQDAISEVKSEIYKIHWTSRDELITYTKIVVIATGVFGMGIYFSDLLVQSFLNGLGFLIRLIA